MTRVLHVIGQLVPGGSEKMTVLIAKEMCDRDQEHSIAVLGETDLGFVESLGGGRVPLHRLKLRSRGPLSGVEAVRAICSIAKDQRVDLVQGHALRSSVVAGVAGRLSGRPAVATLHRIYYPSVERRIDRHVQRLWSGIVVDSCAVKDLLAREVCIDRDRCEVIPNFVSDELFDMPKPVPEPDRPMRMLMAAHFAPVKGHRFALEALASLDESAAGGAELDLLGEGPMIDECRRLAADLGVDRLVGFHGRRSDLGAWLQRADVVVLPSLWEGFGVILAEAMACGRPVVSFNVGGAAEIVVDGQTGYLTEPADVFALAESLAHLRDDADLRARMGSAGRERARKLYTARNTLDAYQDFYRRTVAAG
jgi:glycosyltransferase involved in cell wall biosynthesis